LEDFRHADARLDPRAGGDLSRLLQHLDRRSAESIHVTVVDPLPPGRFDPDGIHGAIWGRLMAGDFEAPAGKPLTLVSYAVRHTVTAFVEPMPVGAELIDMPVFLTPERYVPVPLEETYNRAWSGVPQRWRRVIEAV
jgi:hypothetical protein